jgi:hypothetical protein
MEKKTPSPSKNSPMSEFMDLYGQAIDALIARSKTEEPFSADLAATIDPTLRSLGQTKDTLLRTVHDELSKTPAEGRAALDEQVQSVGGADLLRAGIAAAQVPTADVAVSARRITMYNGALRIPWLEIIKEILNVLLDLIPGIPAFLKKLLKELLKLLDKIFGGMPHEDNAQVAS